MRSYEKLRRKRVMVGTIGFIFGLGIGAITSYLIRGAFSPRIVFASCFGGIALALYIGEKLARLPTEDDLHTAQFEEAISPLGLIAKDGQTPKIEEINRKK